MGSLVTPISCASCGAPSNAMGSEEFRCGYCGSRNQVNQEVVLFVGRHRAFADGPAKLLQPLTGLIQAIASLRARKSAEMERLVSKLHSMLSEYQEAVTRLENAKANAGAITKRTNTALFRATFALITVIAIALLLSKAASMRWYKLILPIFGTTVIAFIGGWPSVVAGAIAAFSGKAGYWACALAGAFSLAQYWHQPSLLKAALKTCESEEDARAARQRKLRAAAERLLSEHRPLISIALTFLRCLDQYHALEKEIPIGVKMDHAIAALNDMTFGSIVQTCEQVKNVIQGAETAFDFKLEKLKYHGTRGK